jgi:tRNA A-37 threonylcarbamoyl transferase component Bud32
MVGQDVSGRAEVVIVRTLLFTMKMTSEEHARFVRVAEKWGLNIANLLRTLVAREERIDEVAESLSEPYRKNRKNKIAVHRKVAAVRARR